jgi:glycosyltransferase involved in cell wall biosynthesis
MTAVSVVVPLRDEEAGVEALIDDLCAQQRAPEAILMVDTGSRDRTRELVAARARRDARVSLLCLPAGYPGAGRNAGLRAARTPWVAFADGGTRVSPDWLAHLMAPVDGGQAVDVVLGNMEAAAQTREQRAAALAYVPARRALPDGRPWRGFFLASSAVRREAAFAAGGFAEHLRSGEDLLFLRALERADNVAYAPAAVVHWSHSCGGRAVWRRFRTYAEHSLRAGLMDDWFAVMRRRYLWMLLLGPAFPLGVAALLLARAAVMQRRKPEFAARGIGRLVQVVEVAGLLGVIDAATWAAWLAWRRAGAPRAETAGALAPSELGAAPRAVSAP